MVDPLQEQQELQDRHSREYAKSVESVDSLGSQSSESGHMSLFTVNFFLSGVHQSSDLDPMTPDQSQTCL